MNALGVGDHHQISAIAGKALRNTCADAAASAGDNHCFIMEISLHIFSLSISRAPGPAEYVNTVAD